MLTELFKADGCDQAALWPSRVQPCRSNTHLLHSNWRPWDWSADAGV